MNHEYPVLGQPSIANAVDPVKLGTSYGRQAGLLLSAVYIYGVAFLFFGTWMDHSIEPHLFSQVATNVLTLYIAALMIGTIAWALLVIPTCMVAGVAGGVVGWTFRLFEQRMPLLPAILYGFGVSLGLVLLLLSMSLPASNLPVGRSFTDPFMWGLWYAPALVAFVGLWWVAYQVNQQLPKA